MRRVALPLLLAACCVGCGSAAPPSALRSTASDPSARATDATDASTPIANDDVSSSAPDTTIADDISWLEPFGTEAPIPPAPDGWQVMDVGAVRFAVPADWQVPMSGSCLVGPAAGVVLLPFMTGGASCEPSPSLPGDQLTITKADGPDPTTSPDTRVGNLDAWQDMTAPVPTYRLTGGMDVSVTGPEATQVLATFTTSGAHRALQDGPLADTTDWHTVTFDGVSLLVPTDWTTYDLADQDPKLGLWPDPGTCGDSWFRDGGTRALLGNVKGAVGCVMPKSWPTQPFDGVWIRDIAGADLAPIATSGTIGGVDVSVAQPDALNDTNASPILDLSVHTGAGDLRITLGIGLDPSVARTILRSIHATGQPLVAPPSTDVTTAPTDAVVSTTTPTNPDSTTTTTTIARPGLDPDPIRVTMADGCPASVANHPDYGSTAAEWISNPDPTGLDADFVPGTPTSALVCRYVALDARTVVNGQAFNGGTLLTSTPLGGRDAGRLADTLNAIVPWNFTSACMPPEDKARYTAIVFAIDGREDVDVWLKDWYGCPEVGNGRRFSGELINGQGTQFTATLNGLVPPAPNEDEITSG